MPVITFKYEDLEEFGINIEKEKLIDILPMMGSDIEDYNDEEIKVEFFPNRPDNLSIEGVARSFKGFISQELGIPNYKISKSNEKVIVDKEILKIRPFIAFAKIKNVRFTENKLKQIMDFQENLHWVIGRDRKKVAIGIHNADVVEAPYKYIASSKNENSFISLETDYKMTPEEILKNNEKGAKYSHLLEEFDKYPLILDNNKEVLSMPPIINGELTKLTEDTTTIIVDVTGTDEKAVNQTLNIICSSFGEVGGEIESMDVVYPDKTITSPEFKVQNKIVHVDLTNELIGGTSLSAEDISRLLQKARFDSKIIDDNNIEAIIPPYRIDILHEVDIIENIAIQYCIKKIETKLPNISTIASEHNWFKSEKTIREVMIGLGFQELMSLMLTSEKSHYENMLQKEDEHVEVSKPITIDRTMIRKSLINSLMEFLEDNKHEDFPQKLFEIGDVLYLDDTQETKVKTLKKLAGVICHSNANFTEMKTNVTTILNNLGYSMELSSSDNPSFINGRVANLKGKSNNGEISGFFGEISPEVIRNFTLEYPVIAFEITF
ncbi:MAG: phenylalanine--tRNA ligase subunit beta [Methanobacteriaceae archaeon]|jgi:phenylalanyl-tRNA synthetase beta chain|nr:phenylalanine--tRNA ligase subunit beta [Methanobacteriaceae archaeon]